MAREDSDRLEQTRNDSNRLERNFTRSTARPQEVLGCVGRKQFTSRVSWVFSLTEVAIDNWPQLPDSIVWVSPKQMFVSWAAQTARGVAL